MMTADRAALMIAQVQATGDELAAAIERVMQLEDGRALVKAEAIRRMVGTENPLNGKPHSASSAEAIVESDAEYAGYRKQQRDAEVEKHRAYAAYEAARLSARLAVELCAAQVSA
jgi:hypothetical protein